MRKKSFKKNKGFRKINLPSRTEVAEIIYSYLAGSIHHHGKVYQASKIWLLGDVKKLYHGTMFIYTKDR
jgi:hypothetical protein